MIGRKFGGNEREIEWEWLHWRYLYDNGEIVGVEGIERNMMAFGKRWKFAGDFGGFIWNEWRLRFKRRDDVLVELKR